MDPRLEGKKIFILTATCDSRLGTVAAISTFLASRHGFIVDMHQFDDVISGRFFVRTVFFGDITSITAEPLPSRNCRK